MSEFTKGPWTLEKVSGFDYGADQYWIPGICTNVRKHDANLIAAAPDLHGVCTEIESPLRVAISMLRRGTPSQNEIADELQLKLGDLCTALAKANGQEKGE